MARKDDDDDIYIREVHSIYLGNLFLDKCCIVARTTLLPLLRKYKRRRVFRDGNRSETEAESEREIER